MSSIAENDFIKKLNAFAELACNEIKSSVGSDTLFDASSSEFKLRCEVAGIDHSMLKWWQYVKKRVREDAWTELEVRDTGLYVKALVYQPLARSYSSLNVCASWYGEMEDLCQLFLDSKDKQFLTLCGMDWRQLPKQNWDMA